MVVDIDNFISRLPHDDKAGMHKLLHDIIKQNAKLFTYDDVVPFVEGHQESFDMLLLTHGNKELQTEKIKHSGLPSSLPHVITVHDKTKVLGDSYDPSSRSITSWATLERTPNHIGIAMINISARIIFRKILGHSSPAPMLVETPNGMLWSTIRTTSVFTSSS